MSLSDEELMALRMRYAGASIKDIAHELCLSTSTISRWCIAHGLREKDKPSKDEVSLIKQRAIQLRQRGYSYNQILAEVGVSKSTLSSWLRSVPLSPTAQSALSLRSKEQAESLRVRNSTPEAREWQSRGGKYTRRKDGQSQGINRSSADHPPGDDGPFHGSSDVAEHS